MVTTRVRFRQLRTKLSGTFHPPARMGRWTDLDAYRTVRATPFQQALTLKSRPLQAFSIALALVVAGIALIGLSTRLVANAALMLLDRSNFIPAQSSILSFEPYVTNDGSSNYWLYGKDGRYYYHFTYEQAVPYLYIEQDNACPRFDREDVRTWCTAHKGSPR